MEAEDVEVMRRLVESGFGYAVLPESALRRQPRYFQALRIPGHRIVRQPALATPLEARPRALTNSIIDFLRAELAGAGNPVFPG